MKLMLKQEDTNKKTNCLRQFKDSPGSSDGIGAIFYIIKTPLVRYIISHIKLNIEVCCCYIVFYVVLFKRWSKKDIKRV